MFFIPLNIQYIKTENFNPNDYQGLGIYLSQQFGITIKAITQNFIFRDKINIQNIPEEVVYAYNARLVKKIYDSIDMIRFTKNSIGLHWYAGHSLSMKYANEINHRNYPNYHNILCETIGKVYE